MNKLGRMGFLLVPILAATTPSEGWSLVISN